MLLFVQRLLAFGKHIHFFNLKGIRGKHGVAIFCVLVGYFASAKRNIGLAAYAVKRYLQFAINILIVLVTFSIVHASVLGLEFTEMGKDVLVAFKESVIFRDGINPTLRCVRDLFFGSLVCFVLGNCCNLDDNWKKLAFVLAIAVFEYFTDVWISICILGAALRVFQGIVLPQKVKPVLCVLFVVAIPLLYRHEESTKIFLMQGLSCGLFMYVNQSSFGKHLPRFRLLPFLGNISFYMILWHTPINRILISMNLEWKIWLLFGVSFSATMLMAVLQDFLNAIWIDSLLKKTQKIIK